VELLKILRATTAPLLILNWNRKIGAICRNTDAAIAMLLESHPEFKGRLVNFSTNGITNHAAARELLRAAEEGQQQPRSRMSAFIC
jgi:hypothetical protein